MTFITVRKDRFFSSQIQIQIQIQIIELVARRLKVAAAFSDRLVSYTLFPTMGQQNEESTLLLLFYLLITKGPTGHVQCCTKTQKYNKTQ